MDLKEGKHLVTDELLKESNSLFQKHMSYKVHIGHYFRENYSKFELNAVKILNYYSTFCNLLNGPDFF